jgi:low temperature requirement protein LtrA
MRAARREEERVTPLELFFDLVFVLAITQCTALMAHEPTWAGVAKGLLVLGVLWWSWVGYAWLTSVLDPEEGAVRLVMFAAMAALLIVALCVPEAFDDLGLTFAIAYGFVRGAHIALFWIASNDHPELRRSVIGLGLGTAVGVGILVAASFFHGGAQGALWALALGLDMAEPYFFGSEGWELEPGHFAERHGLIVIIALGESIVAIGAGAEAGVDAGVIIAAVLGIGLAACMWWTYFDVVVYVSSRRLGEAPEGKVRNELARDGYSYLHFPMVAGIVLAALGMKTTLQHTDEPLSTVAAAALLGGVALYLLGHVAFRFRQIRTVNVGRTVVALSLVAFVPIARQVEAVVTVSAAFAVLVVLIALETKKYGENRDRVRHPGPA